jgi:uncharacterized protein YjiK
VSLVRQIYFAVIFSFLLWGCSANKKKLHFSNSERYDLATPVVIKLPQALDEISGIIYYPKDTSVFAIIDEDGLLFKVGLNQKQAIKKWDFDKKRDFEDLVLRDSTFYVLISNGDVETIHFANNDSIITSRSKVPDADKKINEFESMYYDDSLHQIILLCKNCEDDGSKTVTAWAYNDSTQEYSPAFTIDMLPIAEKLGDRKLKLKPSAAAINPATGELYILSSIEHLLVVTDRKGVFKELYHLDPSLYKQAEGLAFTPAGDLIISNEWHETGAATILLIKNKKK